MGGLGTEQDFKKKAYTRHVGFESIEECLQRIWTPCALTRPSAPVGDVAWQHPPHVSSHQMGSRPFKGALGMTFRPDPRCQIVALAAMHFSSDSPCECSRPSHLDIEPKKRETFSTGAHWECALELLDMLCGSFQPNTISHLGLIGLIGSWLIQRVAQATTLPSAPAANPAAGQGHLGPLQTCRVRGAVRRAASVGRTGPCKSASAFCMQD